MKKKHIKYKIVIGSLLLVLLCGCTEKQDKALYDIIDESVTKFPIEKMNETQLKVIFEQEDSVPTEFLIVGKETNNVAYYVNNKKEHFSIIIDDGTMKVAELPNKDIKNQYECELSKNCESEKEIDYFNKLQEAFSKININLKDYEIKLK